MRIRALSALIAVLGVAGIYWFLKTDGLLLIGLLVSAGSIFEYARLTFRKEVAVASIRWSFVTLCLALLLTTTLLERPIAAVAQVAGGGAAGVRAVRVAGVPAAAGNSGERGAAFRARRAGAVG